VDVTLALLGEANVTTTARCADRVGVDVTLFVLGRANVTTAAGAAPVRGWM
jgi:hypothetical protein